MFLYNSHLLHIKLTWQRAIFVCFFCVGVLLFTYVFFFFPTGTKALL